MPVYRIGTGRGETVHAFAHELDAWMATVARTRDLEEQPGDAEPLPDELPAGPKDDPTAETTVSPVAASGDAGQSAQGRHAAAGVAICALVGVLVGVFWWRLLPVREIAPIRTASLVPAGVARGEPASVKADVDTFRVLDANNLELFHKTVEARLSLQDYDRVFPGGGRMALTEDIDGDGAREVVVGVAVAGHDRDRLVAWDAGGKELFTHVPTRSVRFGDRDYSPPWEPARLFVTGPPGQRRLWISWIHAESGYFPCLLESLSPKGEVLSEHVSAGYVSVVKEATVQGRPSVLVAASNNDRGGTSLALFDRDHVNGSVPAVTADKTCRNCPPGGPRAFLVFPRLESKRLVDGCPAVYDVRVQQDGEMTVWVDQASDFVPQGTCGYRLGPDLRPLSAWIHPNYRTAHDLSTRAGKLDHPFGARDLAELWPVYMLDGARWIAVRGKTEK